MADLKTNYVDDVLDTSVNVKRKYRMIQNADGTVSFDDVTTYTQNGDSFGAKDINDTNAAVNELNSNLNGMFIIKKYTVTCNDNDYVKPFTKFNTFNVNSETQKGLIPIIASGYSGSNAGVMCAIKDFSLITVVSNYSPVTVFVVFVKSGKVEIV